MFDDIIKGKVNEHEAPVPPDAWNNIVQKKKKKKRLVFWWWSSAVLLMMLGTAGYFVIKEDRKKPSVADNSIHKNKSTNTVVPADKNSQSNAVSNTIPGVEKNVTVPVEPAKTVSAGVNRTASGVAITVQNSPPEDIEAASEPAGKFPAKQNRKKIKGRSMITQSAPLPAEDNVNENVAAGTINNSNDVKKEEEQEDITVAGEKEKQSNQQEKSEAALHSNENKKEESKTQITKKNTTLTKQPHYRGWFLDAGIAPLLPLKQFAEPVSYIRTQLLNNTLSEYSGQLSKTTIAPSVAFSFTLRRELSKKLQAGIGLQYLVVKENISIEGVEKNTLYTVVQRLVNGAAGPALINDTITTITEGSRTISAVNSYHIYSIPVFMQYHFIQNNRWSLAAAGGVYFNFAGRYHNTINDNATSPLLPVQPQDNSITKIDVFTSVRVGKMIGSRIELFAMPSLRLGTGHYNFKNSLLNRNMKQACVGFGVSYKIK